ncbi:retron system putative HNH endonuclease [Marinobacter salarius]|uniref:retron system putative HNH endonuclease n=1 Tax=Marinobacter salarius TaxID=1420917 RepID=UPI001A17CB09|nr:retron system putative HNH endonuclease [Marinobacter salarius]HIO30265.1 TIGR02646 family protein [Marinobacter salarius]HIO98731.1 TIGR02646 family protein [Marinobacter salarius]
MRTIQKISEPASLTAHRKKPHANYDNYPDKDSLRQTLVTEQLGLCCYCQSRIRPDAAKMKIEHWRCQADHPQLQLDYQNLLAACLGGTGLAQSEQHCDTAKANQDLSFPLTDRARPIEQKLKFLANGRVESEDIGIETDLNMVLNLNQSRLVKNRKAVLTAFQQRLQTGKKLDVSKELSKWDGSTGGEMPEFSQVISYYLYKKLRRA